ncbi:acyl carrier protein [Brucella intermedia]|uniref:acyl carrier protein n=1 Tax=Brucella intermedia TaxID=94625 RepID=UPI00224AAF21|nr:acyl carrier protein [Brucella intermedia]
MATAFERVRDILVLHLGVAQEHVAPTAAIIDDLGADSLDLVELIMAFENEFEVEVSDYEAEKWLTVQDAVKAAERLTAEAA